MKRSIVVILAFAVVLCMAFMLTSNAATVIESDICGENVTYTLDTNGVLTVSGSGAVSIAPWYDRRLYIEKVVIEYGVTAIASGVFEDCTNLKSVKLSDTVTTIEPYAFSNCDNLKSVSVSYLAPWCNIDFSVSSGANLFEWADDLYVDEELVDELVIPSEVVGIADSAFASCGSLTSVTVPDGVKAIGDYAFYNCDNLKSVSISESVTTIGEYAFADCDSLTGIVIPNGVISVGDFAFYHCDLLSEVTVSDTVESIGVCAFSYCDSLGAITVSAGNKSYSSDKSGILYNKDKTVVVCCPSGTDSTSLVIPDGVEYIDSYAFAFCDSLTSVIVSDSVKGIGSYAFSFCNGLREVTVNEGMVYIDSYAFYSCDILNWITVPDSVESIGDYAFYGCTSLSSISIGAGVKSIGYGAFDYCESLGIVYNYSDIALSIGHINNGFVVYYANVLVDKNGNAVCREGYSLDENGFLFDSIERLCGYIGNENPVTLPTSFNGEPYIISYMRGVRDVIIPDGMTSIGRYAFSGCTMLNSVEIPQSVTKISGNAFADCINLKSVTIPKEVTYIGKYALGYCYSNGELVLIDDFVIKGYKGSSAQTYANENGIEFEALTEYVATGTAGTLEWGLTTEGVLMVRGDGEVPNYTRTSTAPWTRYAKQITSIVVENGVTSIGDYAFYGLVKATDITLADSVVYLGVQFIRGTLIEEITVNAITVTANAFGRADKLKVINFTENFKNALGNILYQESVTVKAPENSYAHKYAELYNEKFNTTASITYVSDGTVAKSPVARFGAMGDNVFYAMYQNTKGNWKMVVSGSGAMKNFPYYSLKNEAKGYTFCPTHYMSKEGVNTRIYAIEVLDGVTTVGNYAFYMCTKALEIILPDGITSIGQGAFRTCAKLTTLTLPESVTKIEANAFNGCGALTSVNFPNAVTTVGNDIFVKCNFEGLTVKTDNPIVKNYIDSYYPTIKIQ